MAEDRSKPRFKPEEKDALPADASTADVMGYAIKGRVWIAKGEETFLGYGRIILLERIREFGSITRAARSMEMSYRHAWELVESMNRQAVTSLVETATGGTGGGGAVLTPAGERAIAHFWEIYRDFKKYLEARQVELESLFKG